MHILKENGIIVSHYKYDVYDVYQVPVWDIGIKCLTNASEVYVGNLVYVVYLYQWHVTNAPYVSIIYLMYWVCIKSASYVYIVTNGNMMCIRCVSDVSYENKTDV